METTHVPGFCGVNVNVTLPPAAVYSSTGTTQSQPAGSTAPVMISMQCPGPASVSGAWPAACVAWIRRLALPAGE